MSRMDETPLLPNVPDGEEKGGRLRRHGSRQGLVHHDDARDLWVAKGLVDTRSRTAVGGTVKDNLNGGRALAVIGKRKTRWRNRRHKHGEKNERQASVAICVSPHGDTSVSGEGLFLAVFPQASNSCP